MTARLRCVRCHRRLIGSRTWQAMPVAARRACATTHARRGNGCYCNGCWTHGPSKADQDVAYEGDWVRDGLILRGVAHVEDEERDAG